MHPERWTLVLAGGSGRRLASLTGGLPKQFWSVDEGAPSLLEGTVRRTAGFAPAARRVTVVDRSHRPFVESLHSRAALGRIVYQPEDRGTAAGLLLGLNEILAVDPGALILLTPADHGVIRTDVFHQGIRHGVRRVMHDGDRIVLFGIEPTSADSDYGWVAPESAPGEAIGRCVSIREFVEKPRHEDVARLRASGAVWNTMVLVARAQALLGLFWRHLPDLAVIFAGALRQPRPLREDILDAQYPLLPTADFSRDVIAKARGLDLYTWPAAMGWSDLGTPDRVFNWQRNPVDAVA